MPPRRPSIVLEKALAVADALGPMLSEKFDGVLMLTRSEWHKEPDREFDLVIATTPNVAQGFAAVPARARCVWFEEPPVDFDGNHSADQLLRAIDIIAAADVLVWTDEVARVVAWRLSVPAKKRVINLNRPSTNPQGAFAPLIAATQLYACSAAKNLLSESVEQIGGHK